MALIMNLPDSRRQGQQAFDVLLNFPLPCCCCCSLLKCSALLACSARLLCSLSLSLIKNPPARTKGVPKIIRYKAKKKKASDQVTISLCALFLSLPLWWAIFPQIAFFHPQKIRESAAKHGLASVLPFSSFPLIIMSLFAFLILKCEARPVIFEGYLLRKRELWKQKKSTLSIVYHAMPEREREKQSCFENRSHTLRKAH